MVTLFSKTEKYTLPNGENLSGTDLASRNGYGILSVVPCGVEVVGGILSSFRSIEALCEDYNVEFNDSDLETVVIKINEQIDIRKNTNIPTISDTVFKAASFAALSFTDEQALEVPDLYPVYEVDHAYKKDERFTYNGRLFKVNQDHTSAAQWVPGETGTESLYTCLEMAGDGYLVWTQPTGAHNAYNTGDIVHYPTADDPLYKSLIDGNTTVPGSDERWWELYTES